VRDPFSHHYGFNAEFDRSKFVDTFSQDSLDTIVEFYQGVVDERAKGWIPLPDMFFTIGACEMLGIDHSPLSDRVPSYLSDLQVGEGYCPVPEEKMDGWRADREPEIYSTYYAVKTLNLLGYSTEINVNSFVNSLQDEGYIYNEEWSNTIPKYRFDSELRQQVLLALLLSDNANIDPIVDELRDNEFLTAIYYSWRIRKHLDINPILTDEEAERLSDLQKDGGFREYRLSDKTDEHAGSSHRTWRDQNPPHLFSSFYAYQIASETDSRFNYETEEFVEFIAGTENKNGFGVAVKAREFDASFGRAYTPLEHIMVLLIPSLLR
jgi:hypothetical protein